MPTAFSVAATLEQAIPLFEGTFQKASQTHLFAGTLARIDAAKGYNILGDVYPIGETMEEFRGEATVNGFEATSVRTNTKLYTYTAGIDNNLMKRINAIFDDGFTKALGKMVNRVLGHEEKLITKMLNDNTTAHLAGTTAFFTTTGKIPGSNQPIVNTAVKPLTTAAEVRSAVSYAQGQIIKQMNVAGVRMWDEDDAMKFTVHYHPDKYEIFRDAFLPGNLNGLGSGVILNDKAPLPNIRRKANPWINDPGVMYMFIEGSAYPAVGIAEEEAPNMISTIGLPADLLKILYNGQLAQVRHAFAPFLGSPFSAFRTTPS